MGVMKNKGIGIFVVVIVVLIVVVVVIDALSNRTGKRGDNPYKLEIDQYYKVDPAMILYKEIRQIKLGDVKPLGLDYSNDRLYVLLNKSLKIVSPRGEELSNINLPDTARCIHVSGDLMYLGFTNYVGQFHIDGRQIKLWETLGEKAVITSIASKGDQVFVADAGNRSVLRYDTHGQLLGEFGGKRNIDDLHGFVIPSAYFDLDVYDDELWVVNPGMHALENYTDEGVLRGFWEKTSMKIEGFSGCCNPAQMTIAPDGTFITSEKGLVRIKAYKASGELIGIVSPPTNDSEETHAPEVAVDESGGVFALDFDRNMIRYFVKK